jgi:hypothetical protein
MGNRANQPYKHTPTKLTATETKKDYSKPHDFSGRQDGIFGSHKKTVQPTISYPNQKVGIKNDTLGCCWRIEGGGGFT